MMAHAHMAAAAAAQAATPAVVAAPPPAQDLGVSLAPQQLLPPLVSAYLPSQPPASIVDPLRQRPDQMMVLQQMLKTGDVTSMQVRKRQRFTDGVRVNARKKKREQAIAATSSGLGVRELPDRLDLNLPESGLVNQLLGLEKRLDATIARKHVEIQAALHPTVQTPQLVRLFLWHEYTAAPTHDEFMNGYTVHDKPELPAWLFKMQGQILDAAEGVSSNNAPATRCLSNYLSAIVIQIETARPVAAAAAASSAASSVPASDVETIEWRKHSAVALSDGFEIRRRGNAEVNLKISLFLDYSPPRFRLSPGLSSALGFPPHAANPLPVHAQNPGQSQPFPLHETQSNVLAAFWEYVKKNELQDPKNPTIIKCDATLKKLFDVDELPVSSLLSFLQLHLAPASAEAIVIPYTIRPSTVSTGAPTPATSPSLVTCYDLLTYTPVLPNLSDTYREAAAYSGLKSIIPVPNIVNATARQTEKLVELLFDIDRCNRRREFLQAFSEAPTQVLQLLVSQQAKDQLVMIGVTGVDDELERRSEYYFADWQADACDRMMAEEATHAAAAMQNSASMWMQDTTEEE